jgi:hypothetical protein
MGCGVHKALGVQDSTTVPMLGFPVSAFCPSSLGAFCHSDFSWSLHITDKVRRESNSIPLAYLLVFIPIAMLLGTFMISSWITETVSKVLPPLYHPFFS